jgi:hypothetical protein
MHDPDGGAEYGCTMPFMGVYILIMKLLRCATLHCSSRPRRARVQYVRLVPSARAYVSCMRDREAGDRAKRRVDTCRQPGILIRRPYATAVALSPAA